MSHWIGWKWLAEKYGVAPVQAFRTVSQIAPSRKTVVVDGFVHEFYPASFRPQSNLRGHLTFALKHEGLHLECLARLFAVLASEELVEWLENEPTGAYARRVGFFYEFLTEKTLPVADVASGAYVDALDAKQYFCLEESQASSNKRWRVRNNLLGTPQFCPLVLRTPAVKHAENYDCARALAELQTEFGTDILLRSAVWLTIKESRASFAIEHEENQHDRIKRFANVLENHCGEAAQPFAPQSLLELQTEILGKMATRYGLRRSPVFVGHTSDFQGVVDYIAPTWQDAPALLAGLIEVMHKTTGQASLIRAAIASFAFVYIHPMADGNGRISRFLVNDILRRDGAVPEPFILPISATIMRSPQNRLAYDQSLEAFSKPLMQKYSLDYDFEQTEVYEDGIESNFHFKAYDDALFAWRFLDLTSHVEYLASIIEHTIEQEMASEARYLRSLQQARQQIKEVFEGPDSDIDRIIRSLRENTWTISNKLAKEFPQLANTVVAQRVLKSVQTAFVGDTGQSSTTPEE